MKFTEDQFIATEHSSTKDKAKFANKFVSFVESRYKRSDFSKWFYKRLSMTFGHIAHYNQEGFYSVFFTTKEDQARFVEQCLRYPCYGDPGYTYSDGELALQKWLRTNVWQQLELPF